MSSDNGSSNWRWWAGGIAAVFAFLILNQERVFSFADEMGNRLSALVEKRSSRDPMIVPPSRQETPQAAVTTQTPDPPRTIARAETSTRPQVGEDIFYPRLIWRDPSDAEPAAYHFELPRDRRGTFTYKNSDYNVKVTIHSDQRRGAYGAVVGVSTGSGNGFSVIGVWLLKLVTVNSELPGPNAPTFCFMLTSVTEAYAVFDIMTRTC